MTLQGKLLKEKYKTYEGARKRAAFENGVAPSEYRNGITPDLYHYETISDGVAWRVERRIAKVREQH